MTGVLVKLYTAIRKFDSVSKHFRTKKANVHRKIPDKQ